MVAEKLIVSLVKTESENLSCVSLVLLSHSSSNRQCRGLRDFEQERVSVSFFFLPTIHSANHPLRVTSFVKIPRPGVKGLEL